jgi:hypothetical protein
VRDGDAIAALGYVRTDVPDAAILRLGEREVRPA